MAAIPKFANGLQAYVNNVLPALGARKLYTAVAPDLLPYRETPLLLSNTTEIEIGPINIRNIFGYQAVKVYQGYDGEGTPFPILDGYCSADILPCNLGIDQSRISNEVHILGSLSGGRLDWLVGGYIEHKSINPPGSLLHGGALPIVGGPSSYVPSDGYAKSFALFTNEVFHVTDQLSLSGGLRKTWDRTYSQQYQFSVPVSLRGVQNGPTVCAGTNVPGSFEAPECKGKEIYLKSSGVNWNIGVDYKITPDIFTYLTFSHGYRPGGVNTTVTIPALSEYGTEKVDQIEFGIKTNLWIGSVPTKFNISVFQQKIKDKPVGYVIFNPARGTAEALNLTATKATVRGFEAEAEVVIGRILHLSVFADYLDAKYDSFEIPVYAVDPGAPGGVSQVSTIDASGNPFPNTPEYHIGATAQLTIPVPDHIGDVMLSATYFRQGRIVFDSDFPNEREGVAPAYELINARLQWNNIFGYPLDVSAFVKNLTNHTYLRGGIALQSVVGFTAGVYGEPRTYGLGLRYRFGAAAR